MGRARKFSRKQYSLSPGLGAVSYFLEKLSLVVCAQWKEGER